MFVWTFLLRITHTIISQSSADSSWITLCVCVCVYIYIYIYIFVMTVPSLLLPLDLALFFFPTSFPHLPFTLYKITQKYLILWSCYSRLYGTEFVFRHLLYKKFSVLFISFNAGNMWTTFYRVFTGHSSKNKICILRWILIWTACYISECTLYSMLL